jgi:RNase P/RNase MRP subunit POP5
MSNKYNIGVPRCHREFHPLLASTIPFVTHINQKAATLNTLQVAGECSLFIIKESFSQSFLGTIRSCNKAILSYNRVKIQELQSALASPASLRPACLISPLSFCSY